MFENELKSVNNLRNPGGFHTVEVSTGDSVGKLWGSKGSLNCERVTAVKHARKRVED